MQVILSKIALAKKSEFSLQISLIINRINLIQTERIKYEDTLLISVNIATFNAKEGSINIILFISARTVKFKEFLKFMGRYTKVSYKGVRASKVFTIRGNSRDEVFA